MTTFIEFIKRPNVAVIGFVSPRYTKQALVRAYTDDVDKNLNSLMVLKPGKPIELSAHVYPDKNRLAFLAGKTYETVNDLAVSLADHGFKVAVSYNTGYVIVL